VKLRAQAPAVRDATCLEASGMGKQSEVRNFKHGRSTLQRESTTHGFLQHPPAMIDLIVVHLSSERESESRAGEAPFLLQWIGS
jgi:hypothetical protein